MIVIGIVFNNQIKRVDNNYNHHHHIDTNDNGNCLYISGSDNDNDNDNGNCHMLGCMAMERIVMANDEWKWIVKKLDLNFLVISTIDISMYVIFIIITNGFKFNSL